MQNMYSMRKEGGGGRQRTKKKILRERAQRRMRELEEEEGRTITNITSIEIVSSDKNPTAFTYTHNKGVSWV